VFEIAVSEAITNAVRHGGSQPDSTVTCELELSERTLTLRIIDDGSGFEMGAMPLPEVSRERIEALPASGYGLPIIQAVFPSVRVVSTGRRFAVELAMPIAGTHG
jgi:anti-sigma regulatory factor (Ser/Thr protein kinase)